MLTPLWSLAAAYAIVGPYLVLALRGVYAEPWPRTLLKSAVLAVLTLAIDSIVNAAASWRPSRWCESDVPSPPPIVAIATAFC